MIRAPIESTIGTLVRALRSRARRADRAVSAVLLVGGSSRIPLVAQHDHGGARPAHGRRRAPQVRGRARRGHGRCRARRAGRAGGRRRPGVGPPVPTEARVGSAPSAPPPAAAPPPPGRAGRRGPRRRARPGRRLRGRLDRWPRARGRVRDVTVRVRRHAVAPEPPATESRPGEPPYPDLPPPPYNGRGTGERRRTWSPPALGHAGRRLHRYRWPRRHPRRVGPRARRDAADRRGVVAALAAGRRGYPPSSSSAVGHRPAPPPAPTPVRASAARAEAARQAAHGRRERAHPGDRRGDPGRQHAGLRRHRAERHVRLRREPRGRRRHRRGHRDRQGRRDDPAAGRPAAVPRVRPDGSRLYVSVFQDSDRSINEVAVLDTRTNTVLTTIKVGTRPYALAVRPDGSEIYVPNHVGHRVGDRDQGRTRWSPTSGSSRTRTGSTSPRTAPGPTRRTTTRT